MKAFSSLSRVLFALAALTPAMAFGQFALTGTSYTQDFNSIGTALPSGWAVETGATASSLGTAATFNTSAATWSATTGQFANFASASIGSGGTQATATDRALGVRQTGSFGDPGASFTFNFNSTGDTLSAISLDLMMLNVQTRSTTWSVQYATGASPTSFTTAGTYADPGAFGTTTFTTFSAGDLLALSNQSSAWIRIVALSASTGSNNRDTFGIDNFSMTFSNGGPVAADVSRGAGASFTASSFGGNAFTSIDNAVFDGTATTVNLSGAVVAGGLKFVTTGYTLAGTASDSIAVTGPIDVATSTTGTISGKITGSNALTKTGAGTLVLSGANDFVGNVAINAGTLSISSDGNLGNTANDITLGGTLATTASISLDAGRDLSGTGTLDIANGTTLTTNGTVNANLTLANTGSVVFNGASNTLSGLTINNAVSISGNAITLTGGVTTGSYVGTTTIGNSLALGSAARTFNVVGDLTLSGNITSTGISAYLTKTGTGTLTLSGDNSGLTAGVQIGSQSATPIDGGTVNVSAGNQLGTTALRLNYGTLNATSAITTTTVGTSIGGRTGSVAVISGSDVTFGGTNQFFGGAGTSGEIRLDVNNKTTFSGNFIAPSGTLGGGVTIGGTGTVVYGGTGNFGNLTGTPLALTLINTVTLQPGGLTYGNVTLNGGGVDIAGTGTGTMTLAANANFTQTLGTLTMNIGTVSDQITGSGTSIFNLTGGTLALTLGSGFSYGSTYSLFSGFVGTSDATGVTITGYDTGLYTAALGADGVLSFSSSAIPEPSTYVAIFGALALTGAAMYRRRNRAGKVM